MSEEQQGPSDPTANDTQAPQRVIRRRNRQPLSCTTCRERKIWCDRVVPCSQCLRRGIGDTCHIENRTRTGPPSRKTSQSSSKSHNGVSAEEFAAIKNRLAQLESFIVEKQKHSTDLTTEQQPALTAAPSADANTSPYSSASTPSLYRTDEATAKHDYDAEAAAVLLEGLTMKGALSLQRHHAGSILREEKEPTYSLGNNSGAECEDDSLVDPLQAPKATFQKCAHEESRIPTDWLPSSSEDIEITEVNQYDTSVVSPLLAASQNRGAFKLYSLTESSLGWGLGWAIAAGEEICRTHSMISTEKNYSEPGISSQRIAILAGIIQELPNREQAMALLDIFEKRVLPFTYSVVHVPTLRKELEIFYALDCPQRRASVIEHVDTCWLGIILMTFTLAVQFRPKSDKIPKDLLGPFTNPQYCTLWHSATKTVLVLSGFIGSPRLSVIQTILLLSLYCVRTTEANHGLIRIALTNAQSIGLHRLGDKARQPPTNATPEYMIRRELAKRIWWALILYEWRDITTTIPSVALLDYFNTPMPGNYNDVDLLSVPFPAPHPRDVVTDMSYMLSFIDLTLVYREQAEIIYRLEVKTGKNSVTLPPETIDLLDTKYRAVLENAPILSHSPVRPDLEEIVEVERWAFQVGAFNKMFQLHRNSLSNQNSRRLCVQMARKTLSLQKSIREKSDLPDLLIMSVLQTFMSTVVLCLNLLYLPPPTSNVRCIS